MLQGGVGLYSIRNGGDAVDNRDNHFDFEDLMVFGMFLLALLTFIFMFCK